MIKRILFMLFMLVGLTSMTYAQKQWYKTTAFAQAKVVNGHYYWGDWESSSMKVCFDLSNDKIIIYSPEIQVYYVYKTNGSYTDSSGGEQVSFSVIDQDNDRGTLRLRIEQNGNSQIYIDFNNIAWVYNVVRTY